jgi:FemAB-related protein (PEP-CTERM system-associated)
MTAPITPNTGTVTVRAMAEADEAAWDAFVETCPAATFFHRAGWRRVITRAFGHDCPYLLALRDGAIRGVLPLVHIRSRLFGDSLSSLPFAVYGGPAAADAAAQDALDTAAAALMDRLGVSCLEYRSRSPVRPDWAHRDDLYATFRRPLARDPDAILAQIPRKQRAVLRKALGGSLSVTWPQDTAAFYRLYATSLRNLGTPVFGRRYPDLLRAVFGGDCDIAVVSDQGQPLTAVMNFRFRGEVLPYYGGGLPAARSTGAYDLLYYAVMCRAAEQGLTGFDFGRSKAGTGAFAFKKNWGFQPQFLSYEYRLAPGAAIPEKNPLNPKYRLMIAAWKRLPLPVSTLIGPVLARSLG